MRVQKKQITKDDGRYLVYYHFPGEATGSQGEAFQAVGALEEPVSTGAWAASGAGAVRVEEPSTPVCEE